MNNNIPFRIFIGKDHKENIAYYTLVNSILRKTKRPVSITALTIQSLSHVYTRPRDPKQSNEFSFTRFLVPWLCNYRGLALYMDCDMLVRDGTDITDVFDVELSNSVTLCKHEYEPKSDTKFLGAHQYKYPCKNWSSLMVFNCANYHTRRLTPEYVNMAPAMDLHQFKWTNRVGELPKEWNWLVGEYPSESKAKVAHFTLGGPYFTGHDDCDYSLEWFEECRDMMHCDQK